MLISCYFSSYAHARVMRRHGGRPYPQVQHQLQRAVPGVVQRPHRACVRAAVVALRAQPVPVLQRRLDHPHVAGAWGPVQQ